ncbi:GntR family transcriptional regulator [Lederbergia lenta]|uniref:GntR family transcriptional regulator n=1 Tax=Lederbergia lenta TaxID=1467 RepID=A0A2X4WK41_LEDLE|nr:GntR family transcriptional regulator [Lederbergia lenta]MCM3112199.1 GntR family transcriptional regulator [Lederbergia lenta]MEC2323366.1 GntR family transcriptional regulator [Lederbergia lenta]SQI63293.1 GntR family transcriptional regulator [Lederbergia lenta]
MEFSNDTQALHIRVKEEIIKMIKEEQYKPNTILPTEAEFCRLFKVSRTTVRTALQQLTVEGYIYREQGRGTFVADSKIKQTLSNTEVRFREQLMTQGKKASIRVVSLEVVPGSILHSKIFGINEGDPVNRLERIRYANEDPLQYEIAYIPWFKAPGLNEEKCSNSLYKLLEVQFDLKIKRTVEHIELVMADSFLSEQLNIPVDTPCFSIETSAYLEDGSQIEYSKAVFRGDRANFEIERLY